MKLTLMLPHYLPPYSPELNPDGLLTTRSTHQRAGSPPPDELQDKLIRRHHGYLRSGQCQPHIVANCFTEKPVAYAGG